MAVDVQRDFGYSHTEQNSHAFVARNVQRKSSNREKLVSCHLKNNPRQKQVCGCVWYVSNCTCIINGSKFSNFDFFYYKFLGVLILVILDFL